MTKDDRVLSGEYLNELLCDLRSDNNGFYADLLGQHIAAQREQIAGLKAEIDVLKTRVKLLKNVINGGMDGK